MFAGPKRSKVLSLGEQLLTPSLQRVGLPIIGYIVIVFFLFQGPVFFPEQWAHWEFITLIYAMLLIPGIIFSLLGIYPFNLPAWKSLAWFGAAAGGGFLLFKLLFSGFKYSSGFPIGTILPTLVYQAFIITYAEESFFRGFLLELGSRGGAGVGVLFSSAVFSVFHLAAYSLQGLNFTAFGVAFVMGIVFGFIYLATRDYAGIGVVWGFHFAYNAVLLFG